MIIKPISDLRNNFADISRIVHEQHKPVFLTRNGSGDMVVMSIEQYNEQRALLELYAGLARSEADSAAGRVIPFEAAEAQTLAMLQAKQGTKNEN
jgi:prevent-host-death family protein